MILKWYTADWCMPCKRMEPVVKGVIEETGWELQKINVDEEPHEGITTVPTFILWDGKELGRLTGAVPKKKLLMI